MEMVCKSKGVYKYGLIALSAVLLLTLLIVPATAIFASNNQNYSRFEEGFDYSEYNQGGQSGENADGTSGRDADGQDINAAASKLTGADGAQNGTGNTSGSGVGSDGNAAGDTGDASDKNSSNAADKNSGKNSDKASEGNGKSGTSIEAFDASASSDVPYEDKYAYNLFFLGRKNDSNREKRENVICGDFDRVYTLNGEYSKFEGTLILFSEARDTARKSSFKVYGDGKLLHTGSVMTYRAQPEDFSINVSGVNKLEIVFCGTSSRDYIGYEFAGLSECRFVY